MNRVKNTTRNIKSGLVNKIVVLFLPFLTRTIMIHILSTEYVGLNSLFTSLLQVLNVAELGFSTAITFSLYKPVAEKDTTTIRAIMALYKKVYRIIGAIILTIGLAIIPFIHLFINGEIPSDINIYTLYLLYLANTVLTYFLFAYRSVLLEVHQRNDIISKVNTALYIIQFFLQAGALIIFRNYYLYVIIMPIITVLNNIICALFSKKMYPDYYCEGVLPKEDQKGIKKRVYGLMIQRICHTTRNSLDNIFISSFLGLNMVALYNNYYLIFSAIIGLLSVITNSMNASAGNSIAVETQEKNYSDMRKTNFIYMWISGFCAISMLCLYQPFMKAWLGESFLLPISAVILLVMYFYMLKVGDIITVYNQGAGLWWEGKYRAFAESLLNIILNAFLGSIWGINGIILATFLSLFIVNFFYGSAIVFKNYFTKYKVTSYYKMHTLYAIVTIAIGSVTYLATALINVNKYVDLIIIGFICLLLPNLLYYLIYRNYHMFKESKGMVRKIIKRGGQK